MEQTKPNDSTPKSTAISEQEQLPNDPWKVPLSTLVEAYPNDFMLRYVIVPTTLRIWWTLACIAALAYSHYRVCHNFWSSERICSSRTHYFLFAVECGIVVMMGYTYYLKAMVMEQQSVSLSRRK